jgi:hypothetical protein
MNLDDQIEFEHLLFFDRKCRKCGKIKSLMNDFYLTRKNKNTFASAYSYECKQCTINRAVKKRKTSKNVIEWEYPDW